MLKDYFFRFDVENKTWTIPTNNLMFISALKQKLERLGIDTKVETEQIRLPLGNIFLMGLY